MASDIIFHENKIHIKYSIDVVQNNESGLYSCFIPDFNIFYMTNSKDEININSNTLLKSFFDFHKNEDPKFKSLFLELRKLGFKAKSNDLFFQQAFRGNIKSQKLKNNQKSSFQKTFNLNQELEAELI